MESTLYPKITNKLFGVRMAMVKLLNIHKNHPLLRSLDVVGTVKLHGAHADIVIDSEDTITFQSRNLTSISIEADNHGFAAAMSPRKQALLALKVKLLARFREVNPGNAIDDKCPLIIAGEYIGSKIQKGVAISQLSPRFVIISIGINGIWQPDTEYADIHDEANGIYNISRSGFYRQTVNLIDTEESLAKLQAITAKIKIECPFAMTFNISGPGEGVVWKLEKYPHVPTTWFKIKPEDFLVTSSKAIIPQEEVDKRKRLVIFAKCVLPERRLEQGLEYLAEMHIPKTKQNVGKFLEWIVKDVLLEEKWTMRRDNIEPDALKPEINRIGAGWYYRSVNEDENAALASAVGHMSIKPKHIVKLKTATILPAETAIKTEVGTMSTTAIISKASTISETSMSSETSLISEALTNSKSFIDLTNISTSESNPVAETIHLSENPKASELDHTEKAPDMSDHSDVSKPTSFAAPVSNSLDYDSDREEGGVPLTIGDKP